MGGDPGKSIITLYMHFGYENGVERHFGTVDVKQTKVVKRVGGWEILVEPKLVCGAGNEDRWHGGQPNTMLGGSTDFGAKLIRGGGTQTTGMNKNVVHLLLLFSPHSSTSRTIGSVVKPVMLDTETKNKKIKK